jgi:hypothetical protein
MNTNRGIYIVVASFLIAFSLTGCGAVYQKAADDFMLTQPKSAWGKAPSDNHAMQEQELIKVMLKDSDSAKFQVLNLETAIIPTSLLEPKVLPVWKSTVLVNAKNSYGAYTGFKTWHFYYVDGLLHAYKQGNELIEYLKK